MVFGDKNRIELFYEKHSEDEERYITIGSTCGVAMIVMIVCMEREEAIRIISARLATKREKEAYYHANEN